MNLKNIFILLTIFGVTHGFDLKRDIIDNLKECASACPKLLKGLVHKEPWAFKSKYFNQLFKFRKIKIIFIQCSMPGQNYQAA